LKLLTSEIQLRVDLFGILATGDNGNLRSAH
jgi:hypothetical protein